MDIQILWDVYVMSAGKQGRWERVRAPVKNFFRALASKVGPAKTLATASESLSVSDWLGLGLKGLEKDKNICNIIGPRAPFRTARPR
jgi:hypothetical protein